MRTIKPGRLQKGWSTEAVCNGTGFGGGGCGARLLVEQPDLYLMFSSDVSYGDKGTKHVCFTCCECGVQNELDAVPSGVVKVLPSKEMWDREVGR